MKKFLSAVLTAVLLCGLLAGCGGSSESSSTDSASSDTATSTDSTASADSTADTDSTSSDEDLMIRVILNTTASEYWGYVMAGAEAYGEEHDGVTVEVVGPTSETSYDEQSNMIETSLSSGKYDGIVISALQPDTVTTLIAGTEIPVVAVNTKVEADEIVSFVGTGNEEAAAEGAKAAVAAAEEAGWEEIKAIEIAGAQGDVTVEQRYAGFQAGVEEAGGEFLEDEVQYANSVADLAVTAMEAIMQNHPEGIAIILCHNDDMAIAAARAAEGNSAYENTIFCGFDGIQSACEAILEGTETMSVAQDAYGMGYQSVETCVQAIQGEEVEAEIDTGCSIITIDNAQERLDTLLEYLGE